MLEKSRETLYLFTTTTQYVVRHNMKTSSLFLLPLLFLMQGCIIFPLITDRYVTKTGKSFSQYENILIADLKVEQNGNETTLNKLKGKVILVSLTDSDSLVHAVNYRLKKSEGLEEISIVKYESENEKLKEKNNPFLKKGIFNALVDKSGKIMGTNIRKIPDDDQCDYYLDYCIFRLKDNITLKDSFMDYKWGMIFFYKWEYPEPEQDSIFGRWLKEQIDKKIIKI